MPLFVSTVAPIGALAASPAALAPPSPLLADNIDPRTGDFRSLTVGMDPVDAQVQLAVTVVRASGAAVLEDGFKLTPRKMQDDTQNVIESDVRLALRRLIQNGDIRFIGIEFVTVDETTQTVEAHAKYVNLRTGAERSVVVVPAGPVPVAMAA